MRRLAAIAVMLVAAAGCHAPKKKAKTESTDGRIASMVQVADPTTAVQLVKGFYSIEDHAWRWTAGHFSVALRPPAGAAEKGARLVFKLTVPDPVIAKLHSVTLSASVNGLALAPETYSQPGVYTYTRDVDAKALHPDAVAVDFSLDKTVPPSADDQRELGLVAMSVGFEAN